MIWVLNSDIRYTLGDQRSAILRNNEHKISYRQQNGDWWLKGHWNVPAIQSTERWLKGHGNELAIPSTEWWLNGHWNVPAIQSTQKWLKSHWMAPFSFKEWLRFDLWMCWPRYTRTRRKIQISFKPLTFFNQSYCKKCWS